MITDVTEGAGPAAPCRGRTKFLLQVHIHYSVCYANNIKRTSFSDRHFYTKTASDPFDVSSYELLKERFDVSIELNILICYRH